MTLEQIRIVIDGQLRSACLLEIFSECINTLHYIRPLGKVKGKKFYGLTRYELSLSSLTLQEQDIAFRPWEDIIKLLTEDQRTNIYWQIERIKPPIPIEDREEFS